MKLEIKNFLKESRTVRKVLQGADRLLLTGISIDSRKLRPGELFVAIRGERFDGHRFVEAAFRDGALGAVVDAGGEPLASATGKPVVVVTDTLEFLMEFAGWYRSQLDIPVVGITGSTGKTTLKEFTAAALSGGGPVVKTLKNENNYVGVPLTLFKFNENSTAAVVELGTNHPGEIAALTKIVSPTHAVVTNIGSGHIGYFGSHEAIYREKKALLDGVRKRGVLFINDDDSFLRGYQRQGVRRVTVGTSAQCDYRGEFLDVDKFGCVRFSVNKGPAIRLQIPGRHNFLNGLLAVAIALELGHDLEEIKKGIENVHPVEQRTQYIEHGGVLFINDSYNSNPESLRAAIDLLCALPLESGGRRFLVVGDMLELGGQSAALHIGAADYIKNKNVDYVFCFGEFCALLADSLQDAESPNRAVRWFKHRKDIARLLKQHLSPGDVVLIKGSRGMQMERVLIYLGIGR